MGRRRNRNKQLSDITKKPYYRPRRLTVGMMEDLCKMIPNKHAVIQMADRTGQQPEPVLRAFFVEGKSFPIGLVLAAKFSWTGDLPGEDEEDDDVDPTEDTIPTLVVTKAHPDSCAYSAPSDCVVLTKGLKYMGKGDDAPRADSDVEKK